MWSRKIRFSWLVFQVLWLLIVLPGHTRGLVSWTKQVGADDSQPGGSCCAIQHDRPATGENEGDAPSPVRQKNCAVCYYALGLTPPPILCPFVPAFTSVELILNFRIEKLIHSDLIPTYFACGPPTSTRLV